MFLDERNEFADATALNTGVAGTYLIGDVIDTGRADNVTDADLYLVIAVDTSVTSAGAATVKFTLASDAQAAVATDGTASVHFETAAIAKATLVAGHKVCAVQLPRGTYERYLGILQTTGTAALTAGAVSAFLTSDPASWRALPDGI